MTGLVRAVIALGIPAGAVLLPMPFLMASAMTVIGVPVAVFWLFLCLPITALCLFVAAAMGAASMGRDEA